MLSSAIGIASDSVAVLHKILAAVFGTATSADYDVILVFLKHGAYTRTNLLSEQVEVYRPLYESMRVPLPDLLLLLSWDEIEPYNPIE